MKKKLIVILICVGIIGIITFKLVSNKTKINEKKQTVQVENIRIPVIIAPVIQQTQQISIFKTGAFIPFK